MSSQRFSRCQVSGCGKPVSENLPKRKLLTCSEHRRALVVDVNGVKSRFCQQCTRMHPLHEFDGAKRGCRKRLKQRNLRRQTSNNLTRQACGKPSSQLHQRQLGTTPVKREPGDIHKVERGNGPDILHLLDCSCDVKMELAGVENIQVQNYVKENLVPTSTDTRSGMPDNLFISSLNCWEVGWDANTFYFQLLIFTNSICD
mmetsp:Transcript_4693/g.11386  ORF Transcript_4693/g.11386 Transcript_4693/m.11386 type:complete len:201 (-) Transcript_4693:499-1101(-)